MGHGRLIIIPSFIGASSCGKRDKGDITTPYSGFQAVQHLHIFQNCLEEILNCRKIKPIQPQISLFCSNALRAYSKSDRAAFYKIAAARDFTCLVPELKKTPMSDSRLNPKSIKTMHSTMTKHPDQ